MTRPHQTNFLSKRLRVCGSRTRSLLVWAMLAGACVGCAPLQAVKPWEKGNLAKRDMTFEGDRLEAGFAEHTYFSKEASAGGNSVGGGGCGCN